MKKRDNFYIHIYEFFNKTYAVKIRNLNKYDIFVTEKVFICTRHKKIGLWSAFQNCCRSLIQNFFEQLEELFLNENLIKYLFFHNFLTFLIKYFSN